MLTSYFLSRTLVPTMAQYLLKAHEHGRARADRHAKRLRARSSSRSSAASSGCATAYGGLLAPALDAASVFVVGVLRLAARFPSSALYPWLGEDFFPTVDAGQIKLHVRGAPGTRIEETARLCDQIDRTIRETDPAGEIETIIDNIGVPYSGLNLSLSNAAPVGPADADILRLAQGGPPPDRGRASRSCARGSRTSYPGVDVLLPARDIVSQILNFGLPAPIDVQVVGRDRARPTDAFAEKLMEKIRDVPGRRRPAHPAAVRRAAALRRRRPHRAQEVGLHPARRRERPARLALAELADVARPTGSIRRAASVPRRGPDAAVPDQRRSRTSRTSRSPAPPAGRPQTLGNLATIARGAAARQHHALQRAARDRHLRRASTGRISAASPTPVDAARRREPKKDLPRGSADRHPGPGREHADVVPRPARRARLRDRARLPADGRQLPVVARPVHHPHGAAGARSRESSGCSSSRRRRSACPR